MKTSTLISLFVLVGLGGCDGQGEPARSGSAEPVSDRGTNSGALPEFPGIASEVVNCGDIRPAPEVCEWALAADAIVLGEVESVAYIDSPSIQTDGSIDADCGGTVNGAIEVTLVDVRSLQGAASPPVSFRIGWEQLSMWTAFPVLEASGAVTWRGAGAIVPGQVLGAALHFSSKDQLWSLMGETLFAFDGSDALRFQPSGESCAEAAPRAMEGRNLAALESALAGCQASTAADDRRALIEASWGGSPENYMLGWCIPTELLNTSGRCVSDSECGPEQLCVGERCQAP